MSSCQYIFWEFDTSCSVSINLSWEFTNFKVKLGTLIFKVLNKLFYSKCQFSAIKTSINSFHHSNGLVKVFCGTCSSSNSSFNWNGFFKTNSSCSGNNRLWILASVLSNLNNIINNFCNITPELFPKGFTLFLSSCEFWSNGHDRLITLVNSSCISISKSRNNLVFNINHFLWFEGRSYTRRFFLSRSKLISFHDITWRISWLLTNVSMWAPNVATTFSTHFFAACFRKPVVGTIIIGRAAFTIC